jgi:hypothetical protein
MNTRQRKGLEILAKYPITYRPSEGRWYVPSQSDENKEYWVVLEAKVQD